MAKFFSKFSRKTWIITGISAVVIVAVLLVVASLNQSSSSSTSSYQTTTVTRGTLTSSVEGAGSVSSLLTASLAWQTNGQIILVNSKIGDLVKANDVLATLVQSSTTQTTLESNLVTAQENLAELTSPSSIATAKEAVATAETNLTNAQYNLNSVINRDPNATANAYAAMVVAQNNLQRLTDNYNNLNLPDTDTRKASAYQAMYAAQIKYDNATYIYNVYAGNVTQTAIDSANAQLALAQANLDEAKAYLTALTTGQIPEGATGTSLMKLKQAMLGVQSAQEALQANIDATKIIAPFDGTVTQATAVNQAVVTPGTAAFRIDDLNDLVVVVQVTEVDINHVKAGQPVTITLDAIPNKTYEGKVLSTNISGASSQNSVNFNVTVQLTKPDAQVKPGMTANVTIVTNQVANALLVPSTAIFLDNTGQQVVYLVQSGNLVTIPVTTGAVSDSSTEITGNSLKEGDTVVLSFATTTSSSGGGFGLFGGGTGRVRDNQPASTP